MAITPEQARAELERRKSLAAGQTKPATITPEKAAAELARRRVASTPSQLVFRQPETSADRQNRLSQYQSEQVAYDKEAEKANSVGGFLSAFGKAIVKNIAAAEVGLGKTIAKIGIAGSKETKSLEEAYATGQNLQADLLKAINENKKKGLDTSRLEQAYNRQTSSMKPTQSELTDRRNLPTTSNVVGQIGGTALDLLTAGTYGKAAQGTKSFKLGNQVSQFTPSGIVPDSFTPNSVQAVKNLAQKPAGLFSKQGVSNIAKGAGIGYAYDVTRGLSGDRGENRDEAGAFIPGAGTAFGAGVPLATALIKTLQNVGTKAGRTEATISKRVSTLNELQISNKKLDQAINDANSKLNANLPEGLDPVDVKDFIAKSDVLNGAVDTNGTVNTRNALDNFDVMMRPYEAKVREALVKEKTALPIKDLQSLITEKAKDAGVPGASFRTLENEIKKEIAGLAKFADESGNIPLSALHDSKVYRYQHNNYTDTTANSISKAVANILKEIVEENATSLDVKQYNTGLSQLYSIRNVIKALDKRKVEGGRLGRHFSSVIGGAAGSAFGPLGTIAGAETGAAVKGIQMSQKFGGNVNQPLKIPAGVTNQVQ